MRVTFIAMLGPKIATLAPLGTVARGLRYASKDRLLERVRANALREILNRLSTTGVILTPDRGASPVTDPAARAAAGRPRAFHRLASSLA